MSSGEVGQSEFGDGEYGEPTDDFEGKKLMYERGDGKWDVDLSKIRGSIKQWGTSDCVVIVSSSGSSIEDLYNSWNYWMSGKLGHSWLILKSKYGGDVEFYRTFVDYVESNRNLYDVVLERSVEVDSKTKAEVMLHRHYKTDRSVDAVTTPEEDENGEAVCHVDRSDGDTELKYYVDLEPTDVDRAGVDVELDEIEGYSVIDYYPVNDIPSLLLSDGDDVVEVPMHYLCSQD